MKGKKYSTEEKIRILRQADGGRSILEVCREANISEVTFHRWKNQFGQMEVSEAKRLKELERENTELKKMLAESLLKESSAGGGMRKKVISPEQRPWAARAVVASQLCSGRAACRFLKVSRSTYWYRSKEPTSQEQRLLKRLQGAQRKAWPLRVSANRRPAAAGGLAGRKKTRAAVAKIPRAASAAHQAQGGASWRLHGAADEGRASGAALDHDRSPRSH